MNVSGCTGFHAKSVFALIQTYEVDGNGLCRANFSQGGLVLVRNKYETKNAVNKNECRQPD